MRKGRPVLPRGNSGAGLRTGCLVTVVSFSFVSSAVSFQNGTGRRFCAQISALIAGSALPGGQGGQRCGTSCSMSKCSRFRNPVSRGQSRFSEASAVCNVCLEAVPAVEQCLCSSLDPEIGAETS